MAKRAPNELAGLLEPFFGKKVALHPQPWSRRRGALGGAWRLEAHRDGVVRLRHAETGFSLELSDDCIADAKRIPPTLFLDVAVTIDDGRVELARLRSLPAPLSQGAI